MDLCPPKKGVGHHFLVYDKATILNTFKTCDQNHPDWTRTEKVNFTAESLRIGVASVYSILREYKNEHELKPAKAYKRKRSVLDNIDIETKNSIRRLIHSFFIKNDSPTVEAILTAIRQTQDFPNFKKTSFKKLLRELGFRNTRRNPNCMLKEKNEIVSWRRRYLRSIRTARESDKKIYYLGHATPKVGDDETISTAFILHIGSDDGFVEYGLLLFELKKTGDYHEEMNAQVFEQWFESVLPRLEENCLIVMDNAFYLSRKIDETPTSSMKEADIQSWLSKKNIRFEENMVKAELLKLVNESGHKDQYVIDGMARASNRTVLRLPPYHCDLNPIELIWAQVKGEMSRKNTTYKISQVSTLSYEAVNSVSPENWKNAIGHVLEVERSMWAMDAMIETRIKPLIINIGDVSSSSSSSLSDLD